jgi:hypothetical protein
MNNQTMSSCLQCGHSLSPKAEVCPKCNTPWPWESFYCYCCEQPIENSEATKEKVEAGYGSFHSDLNDFSYIEKRGKLVDSAKHIYECSQIRPDGKSRTFHHTYTEKSDLTYYRLYHEECFREIRYYSPSRPYDHKAKCSLCSSLNEFSDKHYKASYKCRQCGHPNNTQQPERRDGYCMHCGYCLNELSEDNIPLHHLGPRIFVHKRCYPAQLKSQRDNIWIKRQNLIQEERRKTEENSQSLLAQDKARTDEAHQRSTLASYIELAPLVFAAFMGITSGFGVPHPVFAFMYGAFIAIVMWCTSALVCYPIARMIRGDKSS